MSDVYSQLLDATIQHLQELARRGVQFVTVSPDALAGLNQAPRKAPHGRAPGAPAGSAVPASRPMRPEFGMPEPGPKAALSPSVPAQSAAGALAPVAPPSEVPLAGSAEKAAALEELRQRVLPCAKCSHLAASRKNVVFGVGNVNAEVMFIGEAPGADEDAQGEPFVGKAGQVLTKMITAMGLTRESVYIANILKCRPDTPGQASGNRKPTPAEMQTCIPYLHEQIDLIRPKVIVALGGTALEGLLGKTGITRLRGHWQSYRSIPLMPTYHPSYLLHKAILAEKRRVWEDMLQVMEKLGLPISQKQRNYFLTK